MSDSRMVLESWARSAPREPDANARALPIALLPMRLVLFAAFQLVIAAGLWAARGSFDFRGAALYWPFAVTATNLVTLLVLARALGREGRSLGSLYRFTPGSVGRDVIVSVGLLVVVVPLSVVPTTFLSGLLFGSPDAAGRMMFGVLPPVLAFLAIAFPLTIAFAELPLYLGYIAPRLARAPRSRLTAALVAGGFLALQHCTMPLILDVRFMLWRVGMFLPLSLVLAFAFTWRPRLLPYMMILHALLDLATVALIVRGSMG